MPEQLRHRADVVAGFEQVRSEGVAQRMRAHRLGDPRATTRLLEGASRDRLIQMMPAEHSIVWIDGAPARRENVLPAPFPARARILAPQRVRKMHLAEPRAQIDLMHALRIAEL